MTVEKCLINIEGKELIVYFHDGKKIEEEIAAFEVTAAMFGYDFTFRKPYFNETNFMHYEFKKNSPYSRIIFYLDWYVDSLGNVALTELTIEHIGQWDEGRKRKTLYLDVETNYSDVEKIFTEFKSYLQM